jgi:hypothetical protein
MNFFNNLNRDFIYSLLVSYYDNPIMKKIKELNNLSMYICKLPCLLNEKRYLIAMTLIYENEPLGTELHLSELRWKTFMARVLNDESFDNSIPAHSYQVKREDKYLLPLNIMNRKDEISIYTTPEQPIIVSLLHTQNYKHQYPNEGNLLMALETFQTLISWKD